jgi:hypothetical protein
MPNTLSAEEKIKEYILNIQVKLKDSVPIQKNEQERTIRGWIGGTLFEGIRDRR